MTRTLKTRPDLASLLLVALFSLWRLIVAGQAGLGSDEAHYALYALKPALSYFDHPPMVGWLQIPFAWTWPMDAWMRIMPISLFALSNLLLYRLCVSLYKDAHPWLGFWTLVLINSPLMFQMLSLAMLPDLPLFVFSLLVILTVLKLLEQDTVGRWLWVGLWVGLAGLSKYTGVTLPLSILILIVVKKRWRWLVTPGPWLAGLVALVVISPVLYWNSQNEWVSFIYQINHGTRDPHWSLTRALQSQAGQIIVYTPLVYLLSLFLMLRHSWRNPQVQFLTIFALPIIALFAYGSGHRHTLPHWTALAWLIMTPATAHWIIVQWHKRWLRVLVYLNGGLALLLSLAFYTLAFMPWLIQTSPHPMEDLHGWPQVHQRAQQWQEKLMNENEGRDLSLFVANWTHASRLAWQAYPEPVYVIDQRFDQFDIWFGNPPEGGSGILVYPLLAGHGPLRSPRQFSECRYLERFEHQLRGVTIIAFELHYCQGYKP